MKIAGMLRRYAALARAANRRRKSFRRLRQSRLRGRLHWDPEGCTGCALCVKDCPADAIELITLDRKAKRFVMRYSADRCTFCGQCVENCRFDCISMSSEEYSLAALTHDGFTVYYGNDADVEQVLAEQSADGDHGSGKARRRSRWSGSAANCAAMMPPDSTSFAG